MRQKGGTEVVSAQGGTSGTYALLTLVPTKNVAVVVANSHSQFISNLGERILDMVVELSVDAPRAIPTAAPVPSFLIGDWCRQVAAGCRTRR